MEPIGSIVKKRDQATPIRSIKAAIILSKVNAASGDRYQAKRFRAGRLTIVAPTPGQAQELVLRKEQVLTEINGLFDSSVVRELIIRS